MGKHGTINPIFGAIMMIFLLIFIACCLSRKRQQRPHRRVYLSPVVVTSTTHSTAGGYPVTVQATPSGGLQATPYPTGMPMVQPHANLPYPTSGDMMPQPMMNHTIPYPPGPGFQTQAPYPPVSSGIPPTNMNPPSYDQVVGSNTYSKQAPYNPSYTG